MFHGTKIGLLNVLSLVTWPCEIQMKTQFFLLKPFLAPKKCFKARLAFKTCMDDGASLCTAFRVVIYDRRWRGRRS
jgi:hypothetical protein